MPTYTVCSEILELSKVEKHYFYNLLCYFAQENEYKICLDEEDFIIKEYNEKAKNNEELRSWINWISYDKRNYEIIKVQKKLSVNRELFVMVCASTFDKLLITRSKDDYISHKEFIEQEKICVRDKDEMVQEFSRVKKISIKAEGEKSTIYTGDIIIK